MGADWDFLECAARGLGLAGLFLLVFLDCQRVQISLHEPCLGMIVAEYFLRFFHSLPSTYPSALDAPRGRTSLRPSGSVWVETQTSNFLVAPTALDRHVA